MYPKWRGRIASDFSTEGSLQRVVSPSASTLILFHLLTTHCSIPVYLVQEELKAGSWCRATEIGVHNLMALPGDFKSVLGMGTIHCYLGWQEDKQKSLKTALFRSNGTVPCKGLLPSVFELSCKCV